ncbi:restriction endonuclease subunit S [Kaistella jeonii]|uniref:restriction endonuclease subunit S n=1 Tax=Kaistella jeonii TaxID=266749 RepID=UPI00068BBCC6|nr:restriction endonuclease subunit S [Kaistella jeonii]SFB90406.1 type I restriction enzyme, S subunit [Kaistella jeonii]VEI95796.1 EcoKI restriction-modification system protein HsdS [Kaistella jeonii]
MREGWKEEKIGNYVKLQQGFALNKKSDHYISEKPTAFPLLKISDLINGTKTLFVKETIPKQFLFFEDELIYSRTGQVGLIFKNKKGVVYNNCFKIKPTVDLDSNFLFYFLKQQYVINYAQTLATGTAQPDLNHSAFKSIKILFPEKLETQRKIASILSGYDDLIENNLKRIKILEEMAQQTYEEWFVRMRFPGFETAVLNEETGLPEGWEKVKLGDKIEVGRGSSPRPIADKKYFEGGTIPWLKIADATASKIYIYKTKEYVNDYGASFSRKLPVGSLILAASGTLGFPMFLGVEACIHDGWIYFKGIKEELKEYFYFSFIGLKQYFDGIAYGAAIQNINTTILRESPLIIPDFKTLQNFKIIASSALETIVNLQQQNQRLRESRDLLLPRLMMGMIEV